MAITADAHRWLLRYVEHVAVSGVPQNATAKQAVALTRLQQAHLTRHLTAYWGKPYECPRVLDLKPRHGYASRVLKDGFDPTDFVEWLVAGCSDVAEVAVQENGRPFLILPAVDARWSCDFELIVPITSDAFGYVHVFDVIPKGLPARKCEQRGHKKTAPSAIP
ncbi:hypothetical protein LK996_13785 [Lysobacter sp. A6]|uniref:Uncharacterized protein n=1 Tax=Noviluteimonas lactosilytica TaxID=2888523 RepID=A0ABS8JKK2_9GAMM|nr:hypothetical protein [Lysobacter lactosilyticus]MCC8364144.1 hypothetical protein [Lysobacter lactosilyticus]